MLSVHSVLSRGRRPVRRSSRLAGSMTDAFDPSPDDDSALGGAEGADVSGLRAEIASLRARSAEMDSAERENRQLLAIFDITTDLAVLVDEAGDLLYLNAAARSFYGLEGTDLHSSDGRQWLGSVISSELVDHVLIDRFEKDGRWAGELLLQRHDGRQVPMAVQIFAHTDARTGEIEFYSGMGHDISTRRQLEASLEQQATHDGLTGLPNRALLFERIDRATEGLRLSSSRGSVALLFIDIDHFKAINDSLGHSAGDRILEQVADRIRDVVRPGDTVARFGGDEFVVLCERLDVAEDAVMIADRLDASFERPVLIEQREVHVGVSIGISYADPDDPDPLAVMRDADAAMYLAKAGGRGRWVIFDDALRARATEHRRTETALRSTVDGQDLELHYQPVVSLQTGCISGVEALLRWRRDGELVGPDSFIPLAEETGLIVPIGTWVMRTACAQIAAWQRRPGWSGLRLAVNVSARQLQQVDFAEVVVAASSEAGLAPGSLSIEITESVLLDDVEASGLRLDHLKQLGIGVSLDDFGTGYSSLTYLRRFPVDSVKLDRSFVAGMGSDPGDTAIVTAVVELGQALGLESVAEGIETETHLEMLRALGCDSGQGFLFSPGVPPGEFEASFLTSSVPAPIPTRELGSRGFGSPGHGGQE